MGINDSLEDLKNLRKQILTLLSEFLKQIVVVASAVLAVLISLHPKQNHSNFLFLISLVLLLLCILFGIAALYLILYQHRRMDKDLLASIKEQLDSGTKNYKAVFSKYNKLAKFSELACVLSFVISMILLVIFSFL